MLIIGFTYATFHWKRMYRAIFNKMCPNRYRLELNPLHHCDIFFCSYQDINLSVKYPKARIIFVSGEPQRVPSDYRIDLLIDCKNDPQLRPREVDRIIYFPFYSMSFVERAKSVPYDLIKSTSWFRCRSQKHIFKMKTKFCAYQYRYDIPHRTALFDLFNTYKPVDALGKSRNPDRRITFEGSDPYDDAVKRYKPYKFVICCENHAIPGYITEKLVNAMLAQAIPIYWGAPDVVQHFNPKSFINAQRFVNSNELLQYVMKVDTNDDLFLQILAEPWLPNNRLNSHLDLYQQFQRVARAISTLRNSDLWLSP